MIWFSNVQPIVLPKLIYIIPTVSGNFSWRKVSSYQNMSLSIYNTFNNYYKYLAGPLILYYVFNIIT